MWTRAVVVCGAVALLACQPAGGPNAVATADAGAGGREPALGAPVSGLPRTLAELVSRTHLIAEEWQDEPVLVEVEVDVDADADGRWSAARVTYLAPDADRFLSLETSGGGFSQQRPTLATLQLQPVSADGLATIAPLPGDAAEPHDLAQSDAAAECGVGAPTSVLYATGAPVAWDGTTWTRDPEWRATVSDGEAAAAVDVVGGELDSCLE
jgi:hypothetical protein